MGATETERALDVAQCVHSIVSPGARVLVLGPEPLAWAQAAAKATGPQGEVVVAAGSAEEAKAVEGVPVRVVRTVPGDLSLDAAALEAHLAASPPRTAADLAAVAAWRVQQAHTNTLLADDSFDVVIADRLLPTVPSGERERAVAEMYRVLRRHGTAAIVEVVADEPLPARLADDPTVPAAFQEFGLLQAVEAAKFHGTSLIHFAIEPEATVEGIDLRLMALTAHKGKEGVCLDRLQGVVYPGPFKQVEDDDGHVIRRGERFAVCEKTYRNYQRAPYAGMFVHLDPKVEVPMEEAPVWDTRRPGQRLPAETKGLWRFTPPAPEGGAGVQQAYVGRAVWLSRDGALLRRARVTHRYQGYYETREQALEAAGKVFADASRFEAVAVSLDEALRAARRAGKALACPLPTPPSG